MSDQVRVTPRDQRATWARERTQYDPPASDNMRGPSEARPPIIGPRVEAWMRRAENLTRSFVELLDEIDRAAKNGELNPAERAAILAMDAECSKLIEAKP